MEPLTAAELALIEADVTALIAEWPFTVVFRRGETTLSAQTVRVAAQGGPSARQGQAGQETRTGIVLLGGKTLNVQPDDRFNVEGRLYRVVGVHPDRRAFTQATAELAQ